MVAQRKPAADEWTYQEAEYSDLVCSPRFQELVNANLREIYGSDRPIAMDHSRYTMLAGAGLLKCYAARVNHELAGYASYIVNGTLHNGPGWRVAINDAFFLGKRFRKGARALTFLRAIEPLLAAHGARAIYHGSLSRCPVDRLFARAGYHPVQTSYEKIL